MSRKLVFLKLGGSLITVKDQPHTPRLDVLERLSGEIAEARAQDPQIKILLGHGSGSFGHVPASRYQTRLGVKSPKEWQGFIEVWRQATELNHLVMAALNKANLPAIVFSPSSAVTTRDGRVLTWNLEPLRSALENGLLPVVYGDVVFDQLRGGTILSTEDIFSHLAPLLKPTQLLLAGIEPGVWRDFPANTQLLPEITQDSLHEHETRLTGSAAMDVTGGMADKVRQLLSLVEAFPWINGSIFSGEIHGNVQRALLGEPMGTSIHCRSMNPE